MYVLEVEVVTITPILEIRVRSTCPRLNVHLGLEATAGARVSCAAMALCIPGWVMMRESGNTPGGAYCSL